MAWANTNGSWNNFDMDSTGKKLAVNGDTGGGANFQAVFADSNDAANAVKVDGRIEIARGATVCGEIKPDTSIPNNPALKINAEDNTADIKIGRAGVNGNDCFIYAKQTSIGGLTADPNYRAAIKGPALIAVDTQTDLALQVNGDLEVLNDIHTDEVDALASGHSMILGGINASGVLHLGTNAPQILIAENGNGAIVTIRGPVIINDGDPETRPASLTVHGNITGDYLGSDGDIDVAGELDCEGNADIAGNTALHGTLTVGTTQANANTTLNGNLALTGAVTSNLTVGTTQQARNLDVKGGLSVGGSGTVMGDFDVRNKLKVTSFVQCALDLTCDNDVSVVGALTVNGGATFQSDTQVEGKLNVAGSTSIDNNFSVNGVTTLQQRSYHEDGVALTAQGQSFTGMIKGTNRLELFVDGTLRFYVDNTGGHNA